MNSGLAVPRLAGGWKYAYLHAPGTAAVLFLGWALGIVVRRVGPSLPVPLTTRLVLGGSILTWMLSAMGRQRFALSGLPRQLALPCLYGTIPIIVVSLVVTNPGRILGLSAAILVGYAAMLSPQIVKVREQRSASGQSPTP